MKIFILVVAVLLLSLSCMEGDTGAIEGRVGNLETEMDDVKTELAAIFDGSDEAVESPELVDAVSIAPPPPDTGNIDPRNPAVMTNSRSITELTGEITLLQAANDSLIAEIEEVRSANEDLQGDLESLEGELDDLAGIVQSIGARPEGSSGGRGDSGRGDDGDRGGR